MQTYNKAALVGQQQQQTSNMLQAAAVAAAAAAANGNDTYYSSLHQQHHQQQQTNQYHQELVKSYLNQQLQQNQHQASPMSSSANPLMSPVSSNQPLTVAPPAAGAAALNSSMASFAARLMSLNPYELKCLNADNELMRRISETQSLMESRLQDLHSSKSASAQSNRPNYQQQHQHHHQQQQVTINHHQHQQLNKVYPHQQHHQQLSSQLNLNLKPLPLQEQQQQFLLSSPNNYYQNYYQLLAAQQQMAQFQQHQQQQQQQQQQLYLLNTRFSNNGSSAQLQADIDQNSLNTSLSESHAQNLKAHNGAQTPHQNNNNHQHQRLGQPALDLRTTPTRPISMSPASPISSRAASTGSVANNPTRQQPQQHPKKIKLSEYRKQNDLNQQADALASERISTGGGGSCSDYENNYNLPNPNINNNNGNKRLHSSSVNADGNLLASACAVDVGNQSTNTKANTTMTSKQPAVVGTNNNVKKYKGEFDEPSPDEVAQRQLQLNKPDHYHKDALERGECACVIGSEFRDKTKQEALQLLDNWRALDIAERIKWKWDVSDLPKDIPLSDIKKYEDLRRDFSSGRADFGGASKRKPLGIRGTRQFLLMLYCLWGHPGRDDPMQQDGYCPHCFARIRTENEQSTLVRVVNHFNMKHRRGANPRLSPRLEAAANQSTSLTHNINSGNQQLPKAASQQQAGASSAALKRERMDPPTTPAGAAPVKNGSTELEVQSPQLEVAHTLLSMVDSAAKEESKSVSRCKIEKEPPNHTRGDLNSPELDSENLDPRSMSCGGGGGASNDTVLVASHEGGDGVSEMQSQPPGNSVIKKETINKAEDDNGGDKSAASLARKDFLVAD